MSNEADVIIDKKSAHRTEEGEYEKKKNFLVWCLSDEERLVDSLGEKG